MQRLLGVRQPQTHALLPKSSRQHENMLQSDSLWSCRLCQQQNCMEVAASMPRGGGAHMAMSVGRMLVQAALASHMQKVGDQSCWLRTRTASCLPGLHIT